MSSTTNMGKVEAPNALQTLTAFLLYFGVQILVLPLLLTGWMAASGLSESDFTALEEYWIRLGGMVGAFIAVCLYTCYLERSRHRSIWEFGGSPQLSPLKAFVAGAFSSFMAIPCVILMQVAVTYLLTLWVDATPVEQDAVSHLRRTTSDPQLFFAMVIGIVILVPITEELLFRGFLQSWLKRHLGASVAIFATSVIFTLFHFSTDQGWTNASILMALWVLAVLLGLLYEQTRSLWTSIGLHCTFNGVSAWLIFNEGAEKSTALGGIIVKLLCWWS